jgi:hypothetical protein
MATTHPTNPFWLERFGFRMSGKNALNWESNQSCTGNSWFMQTEKFFPTLFPDATHFEQLELEILEGAGGILR